MPSNEPRATPFAAGPRLITRFAVIPRDITQHPDGIVAQDDRGALWYADINVHSMHWDRLPALPTYDEVPR